ncbi:hypothetical protein AMECASPLE_019677 [Ameca splendens]|uniref:Uncharacterized protein n=1 Tax=Ameca splendens TaxID=208324 RepID=A0ABV0ZND5_9TELE
MTCCGSDPEPRIQCSHKQLTGDLKRFVPHQCSMNEASARIFLQLIMELKLIQSDTIRINEDQSLKRRNSMQPGSDSGLGHDGSSSLWHGAGVDPVYFIRAKKLNKHICSTNSKNFLLMDQVSPRCMS